MRTLGRLGCGAFFVLAMAALGCSSAQDRFDRHMERAHVALHENADRETAFVELLSALQAMPDSAEANFELGKMQRNQGVLREAIFFFEETLHFDPKHVSAALSLALLIRSSDPQRASALLAEAHEREPENAWIYAAESELALDRDDPVKAVQSARRSVELDPDFAFGHVSLGRAHMGMIRIAQLRDERPKNSDFRAAEAAFIRYAELSDPSEEWSSLIEQARVLSAWPDHAESSLAMYRRALAAANAHAPDLGRLRVAALVLQFARARSEDELRAEALGYLVELEPGHLAYWDELAAVRELSTGEGGATLRTLIEERPDNAEAHLRYAGYLQTTEGSEAAIQHLLEHSKRQAIRAKLLGALVEIYDALGKEKQRAATLVLLDEEFPYHPVTLLSRAALSIKQGRVKRAAQDLRELVKRSDGAKAQGLLAYAEYALNNYQAALDAASRASELNPRMAPQMLELSARAAYLLGDCTRAGRAMLQLYWEDRLADPQNALLAQCLYQAGREDQGRKLLRKRLSEPTPPIEVVLEFARREMDDPSQHEFLRDKLRSALAREPNNVSLMLNLAEAQRLDGFARKGIKHLDRALGRKRVRQKPKLLLMRARLYAEVGEAENARRDVLRALELDRGLDGALKFYVAMLLETERFDEGIDALTQLQREGRLNADRTALLGKLYMKAGRRDEGLETMLSAYRLGCRQPDLLKTLTFSLTQDGQLLPALAVAKAAILALDESPASLEMLGHVQLQFDQPAIALEFFQRAIDKSAASRSQEPERAVATLHFRMGLALRALERHADASAAFERAHLLDPNLPLSPSPAPAAQSRPADGLTNGAAG